MREAKKRRRRLCFVRVVVELAPLREALLLACIDAIGLPEAVKDLLYCGTGFLTDAVAGTYIGISMIGFSYLRVQWKYTSSRIPRFD